MNMAATPVRIVAPRFGTNVRHTTSNNVRKILDAHAALGALEPSFARSLLRIAKRLNSLKITDLRFAELVCQRLFMRSPIAEIDKPPPVNPSKSQPKFSIDQLWLEYA